MTLPSSSLRKFLQLCVRVCLHVCTCLSLGIHFLVGAWGGVRGLHAGWLAGVGGASARELGPFAQTGFGWPREERAQTGAPSVRGGIAITPSRPLHRVALRPLLAAPYPPFLRPLHHHHHHSPSTHCPGCGC